MSTLEKVREIIRAEVARAKPLADSSHAIELIAESSVRFRQEDGDLRIDVVDAKGEIRTREDGGIFTLRDLVAELRRQHPTLFEPPGAHPAPAEERNEARRAEGVSAEPSQQPAPSPAPSRSSRDWLIVQGGRDADVPAPAPGGPAAPVERLSLGSPKADASPTVAGERPGLAPHAPRVVDPSIAVAPPPRGVLIAAGVALAILAGGSLGYWLMRPTEQGAAVAAVPSPTAVTAPAAKPADPADTGSVKTAAAAGEAALKGIPEVIDTATLSLNGKVLPLFGVEWVRGAGDPADLSNYLRKREITCRPASSEATAYRCEVEGQDLSKVVLYNGGGRATSTATPDLQAAEAHAKSAKIGLWGR